MYWDHRVASVLCPNLTMSLPKAEAKEDDLYRQLNLEPRVVRRLASQPRPDGLPNLKQTARNTKAVRSGRKERREKNTKACDAALLKGCSTSVAVRIAA